MKLIHLSQGRKSKYKNSNLFTQVDDEDFEYLNQFKWSISHSKQTSYVNRTIYIEKKKTSIKMHREILGLTDPKKEFVDHIDHNGLNNQRCNLRKCTKQQNNRNRNKVVTQRNTSQYKGVSIHIQYNSTKEPTVSWRAKIKSTNKKGTHIGLFKTEIEAATAYDNAAKIYHGEFAGLNFK